MQAIDKNQSIAPEYKQKVIELNEFLNQSNLEKTLLEIGPSLRQILISNLDTDSMSQGLDLNTLKSVPEFINTIRVAVFRAGYTAKDEMHPNSDQFTYSLSGKGITTITDNDRKRSDSYCDYKSKNLSARWHVSPSNQFHQHVAGNNDFWIVTAFHTAKDVITQF